MLHAGVDPEPQIVAGTTVAVVAAEIAAVAGIAVAAVEEAHSPDYQSFLDGNSADYDVTQAVDASSALALAPCGQFWADR